MHTVLFTIIAFGFFMLYNTSKKVKFEKQCALTNWIRNNKKIATILAYSLLAISFVLEIRLDGFAIGAFTYFVYLMFIGIAILSLYPTIAIKTKHIASIVGLCLFFEVVIF
ncbi:MULTISPECIES: hypothetical protein [Myroides]|nr:MULTISPECIES: hypothetical protein [Myroides]